MVSRSNGAAAGMFAAFSDPNRLRLLAMLRDGERCVCELVSALRVPQPRVSRHMARLKKAGLVRSRRRGYWVYYSLAPAQGPLHKSLLSCLDACARKDAPRCGGGRC
ncbi:MAG TPA: metalloregulator ArsR/SmtB family transcription factor [Planctomycetota bacterium]|nr:metalloregulator ArsR/SmtB family transcription factor [Planctomycetota bacterium]